MWNPLYMKIIFLCLFLYCLSKEVWSERSAGEMCLTFAGCPSVSSEWTKLRWASRLESEPADPVPNHPDPLQKPAESTGPEVTITIRSVLHTIKSDRCRSLTGETGTCRKSLSTCVTQTSSGCRWQLQPGGMQARSVSMADRLSLNLLLRWPRWTSTTRRALRLCFEDTRERHTCRDGEHGSRQEVTWLPQHIV